MKSNINKSMGFMLLLVLLVSITSLSALAYTEDNPNDEDLTITLLNQDPDPAVPGDYVEFRFKVSKTDNADLKDLSFELLEEYPIAFDGYDWPTKRVDSWVSYSGIEDYYLLHYKVRVAEDAIKYTYKLHLRYSYIKDDINYQSITFEFPLRVGDETTPNFQIGSIRTLPIKLLPDSEDNELKVELLNLGAEKAEKVVASIDWPEGFSNSYSYSNIDALGNIEGDASAFALFYVDIEDFVSEGQFETTLHLNYKLIDENKFQKVDLPITLDVKEKPVFKVEVPEVIADEGDTIKLKVDVTNVGNKKVESISVRAFKDSSQPFDFSEKSDFVGTLEPGETGSGVLVFDVEEGAESKKYYLDLQIRSIKNNQVFLQEETIPITVDVSTSKFAKVMSSLIGLIVFLAIIVGAYLYGKSKAK